MSLVDMGYVLEVKSAFVVAKIERKKMECVIARRHG